MRAVVIALLICCSPAQAQKQIAGSSSATFLDRSESFQIGYVASFIEQNFGEAINRPESNSAMVHHYTMCVTAPGISPAKVRDAVVARINSDASLLLRPVGHVIWATIVSICGDHPR